MAKLRVKGVFDVVTNDNSQIAININHNGIPGYAVSTTATDGIIHFEDNTGAGVNAITDTYVSNEIIDLCQAYDSVYERRRVAWVKLRFIPKYTSYIQSIAEGDPPEDALTGFTNEIVYVVSDSNGLNGRAGTVSDVQALLANTTGVKLKRLNREFKVFRRSRYYPFAPKYDRTTVSQEDVWPSGEWQRADANQTTSKDSHTWILSGVLPIAPGIDLFTCVFEVKFEWADNKSVA